MHFAHLGIQCTETLAIREGLKKIWKASDPLPLLNFFDYFLKSFLPKNHGKKSRNQKRRALCLLELFETVILSYQTLYLEMFDLLPTWNLSIRLEKKQFFAQKSLKKGPKPKTEGTLPSQTFQDGRFELSNTLFGDIRPIANLKLEFQAWKKQFLAQIRGFSWENLQKIIIYQLPNPYISGNKDFLGLSKPKKFFGRVTPQKMSLCNGEFTMEDWNHWHQQSFSRMSVERQKEFEDNAVLLAA